MSQRYAFYFVIVAWVLRLLISPVHSQFAVSPPVWYHKSKGRINHLLNHLLKFHLKTSMKKALSVMFVFALALSLSSAAFAQVPSQGIGSIPTGGGGIGESGGSVAITGTDDLVSVIINLVNWIAWVVGLMAVLFGLYSGIL